MRISDWSSDVCSSDLELTPDINLYASYNRGTHSGGFSIGGPGTPPYKPEVLDAYEVGLKSRLFDGVLELNMAGRSEEHTSELQSLMRISYAVFCLKKKNIKSNNHKLTHTVSI